MIISLTSFPRRIPHIAPCLESIVRQKEPDDRIVLWLGREQFPRGLEDVPDNIRLFSEDAGGAVEFRFTEDIGPFTKLIPSLRAFPDEPIITVDDDVDYAPRTIEILKRAHVENPRAIFANAVSDLFISEGRWHRTTGTYGLSMAPQPLRMMLGIGAVLYPPHSLAECVFDAGRFLSLSPTNDDIWFWYCAAISRTAILRPHDAIRRPAFAGGAGAIDALSAINESDGDRINCEYIRRICASDSRFEAMLCEAWKNHRIQIALSRVLRVLVHYPRQMVHCLRVGGVRFAMAEVRRKFH